MVRNAVTEADITFKLSPRAKVISTDCFMGLILSYSSEVAIVTSGFFNRACDGGVADKVVARFK